MVDIRSVRSWSEYVEEIRGLAGSYGGRTRPPLFRGLAKSTWGLETTLERYCKDEGLPDDPSFLGYYRRASLSPKSAVETLTGKRWNRFLDSGEVERRIDASSVGYLDRLLAGEPEIWEFFIYLRHHGYPSPLLDWTASPYVAAFFAFDAALDKCSTSVAVYAFVPDPSGGIFKSELALNLVGPYGRSHARHLSQQSWYTWCVDRRSDDYLIRPHSDEVITEAASPRGQVLKIEIPANERIVALKELDLMNVNAFSLFGSEDSLVRTVARRELLFKK